MDLILQPFILSSETYERIAEVLDEAMTKGLNPKTQSESSLRMIPTFVRALPDGTEKGRYLALDLGGTNFRVLMVSLEGDEPYMQSQIFPVSQALMEGPGIDLFDYIADCIGVFLKEKHLDASHKMPLGFTFSFPVIQESLAVGKLLCWTKGFNCSGVQGRDVVACLNEAIQKRNDINVRCVALLNDTVGCLMSCAYHAHNSEIGVILGTGTNACYMEKLDKVLTWTGKNDHKEVIINCEWGAFGDKGEIEFVRTAIDVEIDQHSLNPGKQL